MKLKLNSGINVVVKPFFHHRYIVKNVVDSVKAIKAKGKIDFNHFKEDMISFCEISGVNYF